MPTDPASTPPDIPYTTHVDSLADHNPAAQLHLEISDISEEDFDAFKYRWIAAHEGVVPFPIVLNSPNTGDAPRTTRRQALIIAFGWLATLVLIAVLIVAFAVTTALVP